MSHDITAAKAAQLIEKADKLMTDLQLLVSEMKRSAGVAEAAGDGVAHPPIGDGAGQGPGGAG